VFHVGRLDRDTSGLLLFTNDGDAANRLAHPSFGVMKVYEVETYSPPCAEKLSALRGGFVIEGRLSRPDFVEAAGEKTIRLGITEGRNRIVRRLLAAANIRIKSLTRISIGGINLGGLEVGKYRELSSEETKLLQNLTNT
jgi:pseudouridine synthase